MKYFIILGYALNIFNLFCIYKDGWILNKKDFAIMLFPFTTALVLTIALLGFVYVKFLEFIKELKG